MTLARIPALVLAAGLVSLPAAAAWARDLRPPVRPDTDQSYLYAPPPPAQPNLPGYLQESMDPSNEPFAGSMMSDGELDPMPDSFGLDDN